MTKKTYTSEDIDVTYDTVRCIHAAECVATLPAVFDTSKRPWIQPDQAAADAVVEAVHKCPTGALHYKRKDGGAVEPIPDENIITPEPDGPLYLRGNIEVLDADGNVMLRDTRVALCRCGASESKPFCDNSHKKIDFKASGDLAANQLGDKDDAGAKLVITIAKNGPILLNGKVVLQSHTDDGITCEGSKGALCRCGHSDNKPFCDGSHAREGFEAA